MDQVSRGKWNGKWNWKWRLNWADILIWVAMPTLLAGAVGLFIYEFDKEKKDKQALAALVEQTSFEVSGAVEVFREERTIRTEKGWLGPFPSTTRKSYVTVGGTEYLLDDELGVVLEKGQEITVKGYGGEVKEISILK